MDLIGKFKDFSIGYVAGQYVSIDDGYKRLLSSLLPYLHPSQVKENMSSIEITRCFDIHSIEYDVSMNDYSCACGHPIATLYKTRNILGGETFNIGSKCKDHWIGSEERIEKKCKSLELKIKREKLIRENTPHCPICFINTTNRRCLKCVKTPKQKAREKIKKFIQQNLKNLCNSLKKAFKGKSVKFVFKGTKENYTKKLNETKDEWKKKYNIKFNADEKVWILKPKTNLKGKYFNN
jgi:hypothetical protein